MKNPHSLSDPSIRLVDSLLIGYTVFYYWTIHTNMQFVDWCVTWFTQISTIIMLLLLFLDHLHKKLNLVSQIMMNQFSKVVKILVDIFNTDGPWFIWIYVPNWIALNCIELHWIALHWIALNWIALHCIALNWTALNWIALNSIEFNLSALNWIALH